MFACSNISEWRYVVVSQRIDFCGMRELNGSIILVAAGSLGFVIYDGCVLEQWLIDSIGGERWRPKQIDCSFLVGKTAAEMGEHIRSGLSFGG